MLTKTLSHFFAFLMLLSMTACGENKESAPEVQVKSATATEAVKEASKPAPEEQTALPTEPPALAVIATPAYEVRVHQAISIAPKNDSSDQIKAKTGYRFLVLDLFVKNLSKTKEVDMSQVLLTCKVKDEKGREYSHFPMAIAAYTLQNPDPVHQAQYNAIWSKIKPGESYRTTAFGLEVPEKARNFTISLKEDEDSFKESKRYEAKFSAE